MQASDDRRQMAELGEGFTHSVLDALLDNAEVATAALKAWLVQMTHVETRPSAGVAVEPEPPSLDEERAIIRARARLATDNDDLTRRAAEAVSRSRLLVSRAEDAVRRAHALVADLTAWSRPETTMTAPFAAPLRGPATSSTSCGRRWSVRPPVRRPVP